MPQIEQNRLQAAKVKSCVARYTDTGRALNFRRRPRGMLVVVAPKKRTEGKTEDGRETYGTERKGS